MTASCPWEGQDPVRGTHLSTQVGVDLGSGCLFFNWQDFKVVNDFMLDISVFIIFKDLF